MILQGHYVDDQGFFDLTGYYNASTRRSVNLLDANNRYYERSKASRSGL